MDKHTLYEIAARFAPPTIQHQLRHLRTLDEESARVKLARQDARRGLYELLTTPEAAKETSFVSVA